MKKVTKNKYVCFLGEGERKRVSLNAKKGNIYAVRWLYFIWTTGEVYQYSQVKNQLDIGDEVVIAKVANREGKRMQYDFHKIKIGGYEIVCGDKTHVLTETHFKHSVIVEKLSEMESKRLIERYRKQNNV